MSIALLLRKVAVDRLGPQEKTGTLPTKWGENWAALPNLLPNVCMNLKTNPTLIKSHIYWLKYQYAITETVIVTRCHKKMRERERERDLNHSKSAPPSLGCWKLTLSGKEKLFVTLSFVICCLNILAEHDESSCLWYEIAFLWTSSSIFGCDWSIGSFL